MPVTANRRSALDPTRFDVVIREATRGARDVAVVVERDGRVLHEWRTSSGDDTASRFRIASVSKVLTAVAVLRLVDSGLIDLDRPVLSSIAKASGVDLADPAMERITPRQLLSHTSGLGVMSDLFFESPELSADDVVRTILASSLVANPGDSFRYSNANFVLLGRLLEVVEGRPYSEIVGDEVLAPLGLKDVAIRRTEQFESGDVRHAVRPGRNYMELLGPAGAWVASARSVATLLASVDPEPTAGILSQRMRRMMTTPSSAGVEDGSWTYGLGIRIFPGGVWGHTGTIESIRAAALHFPDGTIVVVLANGDSPRVTDDLVAALLLADLYARGG